MKILGGLPGCLTAFPALLFFFLFVHAALDISLEMIDRIEREYGTAAGDRIQNWQHVMTSSKGLLEEEKLQVVNDFFNHLKFVEDIKNWGVDDYWATPFEFLAKNGGDCEDFAIAKYFTLVEIGVPEDKLRITYVKAMKYNQTHMVLTYFPSPQATPLVLDNLNPQILSASERTDLVPVYSFNGTGLWLAKSLGSGKPVGNSDRLNLWQDLKARMQSMIKGTKN
ncbi:Transglutaminase-like cysteine peptidase [Gammaproteobacteria bacterium]